MTLNPISIATASWAWLNDPMEVFEGSFWTFALFIDSLVFGSNLIERASGHPVNHADQSIGALSLIGTAANLSIWAGRVALISLGALTPAVRGVGTLCYMGVSGFRIYKETEEYERLTAKKGVEGLRSAQLDDLWRQQTYSLIKMANFALYIIWSILGCALLVSSIPLLEGIQAQILLCNLILLLVQGFYSYHIYYHKNETP